MPIELQRDPVCQISADAAAPRPPVPHERVMHAQPSSSDLRRLPGDEIEHGARIEPGESVRFQLLIAFP